MTTPYSRIRESFYSRVQTDEPISTTLERQIFLNALGEYSMELRELPYVDAVDGNGNTVIDYFTNDLKQSEINVLGMLMYKYYFMRERDRFIKWSNIQGKNVSLNGMGDTKFASNKLYDSLTTEITMMLNKLKVLPTD